MRRPRGITTAVTLGVGYALVLLALASDVFYEFATGTGSLGHEDLNAAAVKGVVTLCVVLPLGAVLLCRGAWQLARYRDPRLLAAPLVIVFVFGCIGETIDIVGTATVRSDLIGALILCLTALPLWLLRLRDSRVWMGERSRLPLQRRGR